MKPTAEDIVIVGKRGLSAFIDTNLDAQLKKHKIETIALAGGDVYVFMYGLNMVSVCERV